MYTYISIVRDHSASMGHLAKGAMEDYNLLIQGIRDSKDKDEEIFVTVIECGVGHLALNRIVENNVNIMNINSISTYSTSGSGTPLLDAVGLAIDSIQNLKGKDSTAYLVMVITDGEENTSRIWSSRNITSKIQQLQSTDEWTFVFRGPRGSTKTFTNLGVNPGNILEWEQTTKGLAASTQATQSGITNYFKARASGKTSVNTFFTDINVSAKEIQETLEDATNKFNIFYVGKDERIDEFVIRIYGSYVQGKGFYQLTKTEKVVQDYKIIALLDKSNGKVYSGTSNVRSLLGLPTTGNVQLRPGDHKNYDIFIQSTSLNRKLLSGTKMLYKK